MSSLLNLALVAGTVLICVLLISLILARLYRRATRETSLVRTGAGGRKVVVDGGCIVLPMFHDLMRINMKTLRLEVKRVDDASLITADRLRVDVGVEFYVRVQSSEEGIARAAQTLGERTFDIAALKEMIEGKLVDGLRAVAAQMTMDELHEKRSDFVQQVQQAVSEDLVKNGLELESVSLTALDQTPFAKLDENNAFNALGMKKLAEVISAARRERAKIEAETEYEIAQTKQGAAIKTYEVERAQELARVSQSVAMAEMRAREAAAAAEREEESRRAGEIARISREQATQAAEITRQQSIELAEQERKIAVSQKSEEESRAKAAADHARAEAALAEEAVVTARRTAEAERQKRIAILEAEETAEKDATRVRVAAAAERQAADDQAAARLALAQAEADAIKLTAEADLARAKAEAEGREKLVAAENNMSREIIEMKIAIERLQRLPQIIAEMVRPIEKVSDIRIHQVGGIGAAGGARLGSAAGTGAAGAALSAASPAGGASPGGGAGSIDQLFDSVQGLMVQGPILKAIGEAAGLTLGEGVKGALGSELAGLMPEARKETPPDPEA